MKAMHLPGIQEQGQRLSQLDPKLVEYYHAILDFLHQTNPKAAHAFVASMDNILAGVENSELDPSLTSPAASEGVTMSATVSTQMTEAAMRVREKNISVSRQTRAVNISIESKTQKKVDPLVLDLRGDGVATSGVADGARFDLEANGLPASVSFVQGDDVFLAFDRNGNGVIDDGGELFGVHHGAANGFEELKKFDDNGDGVINAQDAVFSHLLGFWRSNSGFETASLLTLGVQSLLTAYRDYPTMLDSGDEILQVGSFRHSDGTFRRTFDLGLSVHV